MTLAHRSTQHSRNSRFGVQTNEPICKTSLLSASIALSIFQLSFEDPKPLITRKAQKLTRETKLGRRRQREAKLTFRCVGSRHKHVAGTGKIFQQVTESLDKIDSKQGRTKKN